MLRFSVLLAIALVAAAKAQQPQTSTIDVALRKPADRTAISETGGKAALTITSPSGIGGATLTRKGDRWPTTVTLRLNLRGLESLKLATDGGTLSLAGSYSSHNEGSRISWATLTEAGRKETALERSSPYWMDIRTMNAQGRTTTGLPPEGGWFEIDLPGALLISQPKSVTVDWIDFYR